MDWQLSTLNGGITPLYIGIIHTPADQRDLPTIAALGQRFRGCFDTLDGALVDTPYLVGNQFTLADIALGIFTHRWSREPPSIELISFYILSYQRTNCSQFASFL
jgi:glutathione S-transferase